MSMAKPTTIKPDTIGNSVSKTRPLERSKTVLRPFSPDVPSPNDVVIRCPPHERMLRAHTSSEGALTGNAAVSIGMLTPEDRYRSEAPHSPTRQPGRLPHKRAEWSRSSAEVRRHETRQKPGGGDSQNPPLHSTPPALPGVSDPVKQCGGSSHQAPRSSEKPTRVKQAVQRPSQGSCNGGGAHLRFACKIHHGRHHARSHSPLPNSSTYHQAKHASAGGGFE